MAKNTPKTLWCSHSATFPKPRTDGCNLWKIVFNILLSLGYQIAGEILTWCKFRRSVLYCWASLFVSFFLKCQIYLHQKSKIQQQPPQNVLRKICPEYMHQIYRRTPISKCGFNELASNFIEITAAFFRNTFS